jgi:hypothetical protein
MTTMVNCEFCKSLKSFFQSPLTLALSPRWGEREKEKKTFEPLAKFFSEAERQSKGVQNTRWHRFSNLCGTQITPTWHFGSHPQE